MIENQFGTAIQDVIDGHRDTADAIKDLGLAADNVSGAFNALITNVGMFIDRLNTF